MKSAFLFSTLLLALVPALPAQATLGEPETSIENVRREIRGTRRPGVRNTRGNSTFTVHEITNEGTTVREYVGANGVVFGIAWRGYRTPDLKALLGSYQTELRSLSRRQPRKRGQRSLELKSDKLIAIRGGHPRALRGRFIAPSLLPAGVNANDVQ